MSEANTQIYENVFACLPSDGVKTFEDVKNYKKLQVCLPEPTPCFCLYFYFLRSVFDLLVSLIEQQHHKNYLVIIRCSHYQNSVVKSLSLLTFVYVSNFEFYQKSAN